MNSNLFNRYWRIIKARAGVLFIQAEPGTCKSAIIRAIADQHDLQFIPLDLGHSSELDLGQAPCFPQQGETFFRYAIPEWAYAANQRPSLVLFEELNRCDQAVQNGALSILNERRIGENFKFNNNVFMAATGNLGDEDGCVVTEFDAAVKGRLIPIRHKISVQQWTEMYAERNVLRVIRDFLGSHPAEFLRLETKEDRGTSPRLWTFLSTFLKENVDDSNNLEEMTELLKDCGSAFIGASNIKLIRFIEDQLKITLDDVIQRYPDVRKDMQGIAATTQVWLVDQIKSVDASMWASRNIKNVISFFEDIPADIRIGVFKKYLEDFQMDDLTDPKNDHQKNVLHVLRRFKGQILACMPDTNM